MMPPAQPIMAIGRYLDDAQASGILLSRLMYPERSLRFACCARIPTSIKTGNGIRVIPTPQPAVGLVAALEVLAPPLQNAPAW